MQERGTKLVCFITFIHLLCQPGKGEMRAQTFSVFIVTLDDKQWLAVTAAVKTFHQYSLLSTCAFVCVLASYLSKQLDILV